jgi:DNA-binding NtrC family response regulator
MRKTILMVEDDTVFRKQLVLYLEDSFRILEAETKQHALELLSANPVDVALIDLHLPPSEDVPDEGLELIQEIAQQYPKSLVIAISGDTAEAVVSQSLQKGARFFLSKVLDLQKLETLLGRCMENGSPG